MERTSYELFPVLRQHKVLSLEHLISEQHNEPSEEPGGYTILLLFIMLCLLSSA